MYCDVKMERCNVAEVVIQLSSMFHLLMIYFLLSLFSEFTRTSLTVAFVQSWPLFNFCIFLLNVQIN